MIECKALYAGYGRKEIVRDASFTLKNGEITALLGLNGCGKSTLIKAMCGFADTYRGDVVVEDKSILKMNERERAGYLAYIPQRSSMIIGQSAMQVVLMGFNARLSIFASPSEEQKEKAFRVMEQLKIGELVNREYSELSEGQKQLVILARCLIQETPVMLMDEPDSALDHVNRKLIMGKIREAVKTYDKACMLAVHDPNLAIRYCDRLLLMKQGQIIGDIDLKKTEKENLKEALTGIYGEIELYSRDDMILMF